MQPDGSLLYPGRGGYGGSVSVFYAGHHYQFGELLEHVPERAVVEIDVLQPASGQAWWDAFAMKRPALAAEAASFSRRLDP